MVNPNYKFGKSLLNDDDLKTSAPCTRELHTFYMQCGKSMIILRLWSHGPKTLHGPREETNCQTDKGRYLCNSVICMIYSTWMLWIRHFFATSSCKLLESLIFFSLIILYRNVIFASHHFFTMYFASLHFVFSH
jgi:hypothetical protein